MTTATPQARLEQVFRLVQPSTHWKDEIDAVVPLTAASKDELREAVIHFTGSIPTFSPATVHIRHRDGLVTFEVPGVRVQAAGYWRTIGA